MEKHNFLFLDISSDLELATRKHGGDACSPSHSESDSKIQLGSHVRTVVYKRITAVVEICAPLDGKDVDAVCDVSVWVRERCPKAARAGGFGFGPDNLIGFSKPYLQVTSIIEFFWHPMMHASNIK